MYTLKLFHRHITGCLKKNFFTTFLCMDLAKKQSQLFTYGLPVYQSSSELVNSFESYHGN